MSAQGVAIPNLARLPELGERFLPMLNELRESEPIVWSEDVGSWLVLRHADVVAALMGRHPLSSEMLSAKVFGALPPSVGLEQFPALRAAIPHWLVNMDPPRHSRVRALMMSGFKRSTIEAQRPLVRSRIAELLERASTSTECEVIGEVLRDVTVSTIMRLIGIPSEHLANMHRWSEAITAPFVTGLPSVEMLVAAELVLNEMGAVLRTEVQRRRAEPSDDFLSILVHSTIDGDALSEDELIAQLFFLLTAGHESTTNTMALSLVALIRDTSLWPFFQVPPEQNTASVMELMRYVAMSAATFRLALADFEWHSKQIKKGDVIFLMLASANRDPRVYTSPDEVVVSRRNDAALVFGAGAHHCIGHALARMQIGELLPAVLDRFPKIRLRDEKLNFGTGLAFRGLESLWLRWE